MQKPVLKASPPLRDLAALLPAVGEVPGWTTKDAPQHYKGEDLFTYIDGGAEIYHEYGFKQVLAQDYADAAGKTVAVEIFEMAHPDAAFGMYTFKSSGKGRRAGLGVDSQIEDYYLNFWKGPLLATVTGFDESLASLDGISKIAKAIDEKIRETAPRPPLVSRLPAEWAGPGIKYLKGALGLFNIYPFFPRDVFRFREAVVGNGDGYKVFLFKYDGAAEAGRRFAEIRAAFSAGPPYKAPRRREDGVIETADGKGAVIQAECVGEFIALVLGRFPPPGPSAVLKTLQKRIKP